MKRFLAVAALFVAGCSSSAPLLQPPDRTDSFCSEKEPRGTAIASILGSVSDRIETTVAWPGNAALHTDVKQNSGIIGHWKSQPLYMPSTAQALGVSGNYIDVTDVVIDNQLSGTESRLIYVTVATPKGPKNIVLRAYDTQNVCVEGERLSRIRSRESVAFGLRPSRTSIAGPGSD
jgi:hypothetical protein